MKISDLIDWAGSHQDLWEINHAELNLTAGEASAFKALVTSLKAAYNEAQAKREASKLATQSLHNSAAAVRALASAYVSTIRGFAEATGNPNVYVLGGVTPEQPASTLPPPNGPDSLTATLDNTGALILKWKATQPKGVVNVQYRVYRKLAGEAAFTMVGTAGAKKTFTDSTIPFGTDSLTYQIEPWRGDVMGAASGQFTFQFGTGGGGNLTLTAVTEGKLAA